MNPNYESSTLKKMSKKINRREELTGWSKIFDDPSTKHSLIQNSCMTGRNYELGYEGDDIFEERFGQIK